MKMGSVVRGEEEWVLKVDGRKMPFPVFASAESLDCYTGCALYGAMVRYGDRVLLASDRLDGVAAAVYECCEKALDVESRLMLIWVGDELHADAGHAIEACMNWCRHN